MNSIIFTRIISYHLPHRRTRPFLLGTPMGISWMPSWHALALIFVSPQQSLLLFSVSYKGLLLLANFSRTTPCLLSLTLNFSNGVQCSRKRSDDNSRPFNPSRTAPVTTTHQLPLQLHVALPTPTVRVPQWRTSNPGTWVPLRTDL